MFFVPFRTLYAGLAPFLVVTVSSFSFDFLFPPTKKYLTSRVYSSVFHSGSPGPTFQPVLAGSLLPHSLLR